MTFFASLPEHRNNEIDSLLSELMSNRTVGEAIAAAADSTDIDDDELAASLCEWFSVWTAERFFQKIISGADMPGHR